MAESIGALRVELSASTAQFEASMGKAASALGKWTSSQQRGAMVMAKTHEEALKMNKALDVQGSAFDKLRSAMSGHEQSLRSMGQAVGLVVAGVGAAGAAFVALGLRGSEVSGVAASFEALARSVGETGTAILNVTRTATKGLVSDMAIMTASNKALLLGLPVTSKSMGEMAGAAVALGRAMRLGPEDALDRMIVALGRSSSLRLDDLGITVDASVANEKYAASINKTVEQLTDADKKQAFYNAAMLAAKDAVAILGETHLTFGERVQQAQVMVQNFTDTLGIAIANSPVVAKAMESIGDSVQEAFGKNQQDTIQALMVHINNFAIFLVKVGQVGVEAARFLSNAWNGLQVMFNGLLGNLTSGLSKIVAGLLEIAQVGAKMGGFIPGAKEAIRPLQDLQNHLNGATQSFKEQQAAAVTSAGATNAALDKIQGGLGKLGGAMEAASKKHVTLSGAQAQTLKATDSLTAGTGKLTDAQKKAAEAAEKLVQKNQDFWKGFELDNFARSVKTIEEATKVATEAANRWSRGVITGFLEAKTEADRFAEVVLKIRLDMEEAAAAEAAARWADSIGMMADALRGVSDLLEMFGVKASSVLSELVEGFGQAAEGALSMMAGLASGNPQQIIAGIVGVAKAIKGLSESQNAFVRASAMLINIPGGLLGLIFGGGGPSAADRALHDVRVMQTEFINASGGIRVLEERAKAAGVSLQAMWDAKTVAEYEAAVSAVRYQLELFEEHTKLTEEAMERWGLTLADMGPEFQQGRLHEQLVEIYRDFQLLKAAGADVGKILGDPNDPASMASNINSIVQQSIAAGVALPAALKPFIEELIAAGLLLDENGEKITDTSQLTFTETLEEGLARLIDKLNEFLDMLNGIPPEIPVMVKVTTSGMPPDLPTPSGGAGHPPVEDEVPQFARGGIGDFGAGTLAMLHGREAIVPLDGPNDFATGFAGQAAGETAAALGDIRGDVFLDGQRMRDCFIQWKRVGALDRS